MMSQKTITHFHTAKHLFFFLDLSIVFEVESCALLGKYHEKNKYSKQSTSTYTENVLQAQVFVNLLEVLVL